MTTSRETEDIDFPAIRELLHAADDLALGQRRVLLKGLIPGIARDLAPAEFETFMVELRLIGARYHDAVAHPGEGRASRHVIGERNFEGR